MTVLPVELKKSIGDVRIGYTKRKMDQGVHECFNINFTGSIRRMVV